MSKKKNPSAMSALGPAPKLRLMPMEKKACASRERAEEKAKAKETEKPAKSALSAMMEDYCDRLDKEIEFIMNL